MKSEQKSKKLKVYIPLALVVLAVLAGTWYWYKDYSGYITTDDAHVDAENVNISPRILGRVISMNSEEGESVNQGDLIAVLDSTDLVAQKNQAIAVKSQGLAGLSQSQLKYSSDQKSLRVLEISLERAKEDLDRANIQSEAGVITAEQLSHIRKAYEAASAQLDAASSQLQVSRSMISSAMAAVETAEAQIKVLDSQLKNTKLQAPSPGVISKKWVNPGDIVQPGQSVYTLTIRKDLWVVAFLEETRISEIHTGQDVRFTIDAFPDITFSGKIYLIGSTTASVFSLIPANNASGNFTKVTQRIPVRISIDNADGNNDIDSLNILSGMSVQVKIIRG
ncbi:MAG TPA: HlyD family secretion protein [Bacteroidales bacterium]|nr:HlyD family secretion protein [Bacteroidales bacterium]